MNPFGRIGIIGEGKMGTGIFQFLIDKGCTVSWICSSGAETGKLDRTLKKRVGRAKQSGVITDELSEYLLEHTCITSDIREAGRCNLIIETITEDAKLKSDLFLTLDNIVPQETVLASNSSSIVPGRLVPSEKRAPFFLGLHFFYPVSLINIAEVIITEALSQDTILKIKEFLGSIGRDFLILDEKSAFILNRIFLDFQNEVFNLADESKASYAQLDALIREHFFPFGVFEFFDSVGTDIMLTSVRNYTMDYPHRDHFSRLIKQLEQLVGQGNLGKKSGQGFYKYSDGRPLLDGAVELPQGTDPDEIVSFLRFHFQNAVRRHTVRSGLSLDEMNKAVKEYFSIEKGPFEF